MSCNLGSVFNISNIIILDALGQLPQANLLFSFPADSPSLLDGSFPNHPPLQPTSSVNFLLFRTNSRLWMSSLPNSWGPDFGDSCSLSWFLHVSFVYASKTWSSLLLLKSKFFLCFSFIPQSLPLLPSTVKFLERGVDTQSPYPSLFFGGGFRRRRCHALHEHGNKAAIWIFNRIIGQGSLCLLTSVWVKFPRTEGGGSFLFIRPLELAAIHSLVGKCSTKLNLSL